MQSDLDTFKTTVEKVNEEAKKVGPPNQDTGAICQICHKTKFADGVGHRCNYCHLRSCARCGGRMTLKPNKMVWACNMCKKKQDILAKTGQWYHGGMAKPVQLDALPQGESPAGQNISPPNEKRPKIHGDGADKENRDDKGHKIIRTGSLQGRELKRQFSLDAQKNHSDRSGGQNLTPDMADKDKGSRDRGHLPSERGRTRDRSPAANRHHSESRLSETDRRYNAQEWRNIEQESRYRRGDAGREPRSRDQSRDLDHIDKGKYSDDKRRDQRDPHVDRLMDDRDRKREISRERSRGSREEITGRSRDGRDDRSNRDPREWDEGSRRRDGAGDKRKDRQSGQVENLNIYDYADKDIKGSREKLDSLENDKRRVRDPHGKPGGSTHSRDSQQNSRHLNNRHPRDRLGSGSKDRRSPTVGDTRERRKEPEIYNSHVRSPSLNRHNIRIERVGDSPTVMEDQVDKYHDKKQHLDPSTAATGRNSRSRKLDISMSRNDSLSSDPSDCARPPPPKPHKHRRGKKLQQHSISSSDDEIRSTPECSSCEEPDLEIESVISEKGEFEMGEERWRKDEILAAKIKKFLSHPVTWQTSADGAKRIGHMILKKTVLEGTGKDDSGAILGLKIVGGQGTEQGQFGAFITKVKKGSIADTVGHLRPGDEVIEWNGRGLQRATFEEVKDIILESKQEPQVELIVHRSVSTGEIPPGVQPSEHSHGRESHSSRDYAHSRDRDHRDHRERDRDRDHRDRDYRHSKDTLSAGHHSSRPSVMVTSPSSSVEPRSRASSPPISGKIQVKIWYNSKGHELIITVISALDLPLTDQGKFRNPYCKLYLLPDRRCLGNFAERHREVAFEPCDKSKRRTKTLSNTNDPTWNQTFMFYPVQESDFRSRVLEITVWDYDRIGASEFLGEVLIDIHSSNLNDDPLWYQLGHHDETSIPLPQSSPRSKYSQDPHDLRKALSPPVSLRGLSDSDMSELDFDDSVGVIPGLSSAYIRGDRMSLSSLGSSCSPPPGSEDLSDASDKRALSVKGRNSPQSDNKRRRSSLQRDHRNDWNIRSPAPQQVNPNSEQGNIDHRDTRSSQSNLDKVEWDSSHSDKHVRSSSKTDFGVVDTASPMGDQDVSDQIQPRSPDLNGRNSPVADCNVRRRGSPHADLRDVLSSESDCVRDDRNERRRLANKNNEMLSVPRDQVPSTHQSSRSPHPSEKGHSSRTRSRSPSSYHRVPESVSRSLSPPELSKSSPKRRKLPAIPLEAQMAGRDKVTQDLEKRAQKLTMKMKMSSSGANVSDSESYRSRRDYHRGDFRERSRDRGMSGDRGEMMYERGGHGGHDFERVHHHRRSRRNPEFNPEIADDIGSDASETSDMSEVSKVSTLSVRSTQSDHPRRTFSEFSQRMGIRTTIPRRQVTPSSSSDSRDSYEKTDGSMSDSALSASVTEGRKRRPSLGHKMATFVGLPWKSNSASQLAEAGKKKNSFQRSVEVGHGLEPKYGRMVKQASKDSTDGSIGSISSDSGSVMYYRVWLPPGGNPALGPEGQFGEFIEGLGPAQLVGRQVLGSPCLGEIQLGLYDRKGHLEVEVIRARGLMAKSGAKILPAPYVKVYLIDGKTCVEKQKTVVARRTLDPLYQQQLVFMEQYGGKILQVTVWGDYGRMDRKVFMGVAQILLDHLDLTNIVIGWYKLFTSNSLVGHHSSTSTLGHSRKGSTTSLDSGYNNSSPRT
ncbi:regulating synaptic membrane exocytosis protein 2-like isoform X3 [Argopecten irradians]|uniref:regulating synaptic membrane exocytosis protein 2-like isoform X3 n=1 Tax=Argopecten irradians TaxID=31199 RepID=UPI003718CA75